jgi:hypothetical protein
MNYNNITISPLFMSTMMCNYICMIYWLKYLMRGRREMTSKLPIQMYNILQIVYNVYVIAGLYNVFPVTNVYGINIPYNDSIKHYVYMHYMSKYIDYFDTIFMILRKKNSQVSFLHVYHHATVIIPWGWIVAGGHANGTAAFGALINSIIHMMMYSHYFWTSMGYRNPFKRFLTQAQIAQFFLCAGHSFAVILYEKNVPVRYAYGEMIYHMQMIYLFCKFYTSSYA